jgi:CelD/BcsL family acetyltransferase involved in cellulose biosynthesis
MIETSTRCGTVYTLNPLEDSRWNEFVERHEQSSVFHTAGWLEALHRTYGYMPLVLTTSPPGSRLENGWPFCSIDSWLTGRRWVSLPFSDHCQPLTDFGTCEGSFLVNLGEALAGKRLRYFEMRPLENVGPDPLHLPPSLLPSTCTYLFHCLDLTPDLGTLFLNCHRDSTQRKIRRAEREHLRYEDGHSAGLLDAFHKLQILTRRRHGLPPQPKRWFRNLIDSMGERSKIRVAYKDNQAIAAILTIRHKETVVYKYGCSDSAHNNLGGMHLLFWKTIEEAKASGLRKLDLGRSDRDNQGLITFKDRWGSTRSMLSYSRFTSAASPRDVYPDAATGSKERFLRTLFSRMPDTLVRTAGHLLYKHIG